MTDRPTIRHRYMPPRELRTAPFFIHNGRYEHSPHIPIWLHNMRDFGRFKVDVLIDTGSTFSHFPPAWMERLGVDASMCESQRVMRHDRAHREQRLLNPVPVVVEIPGTGGAGYDCEILVCFGELGDAKPLVGMDFLNFFRITDLDALEGVIELTPKPHTRLVDAAGGPAPRTGAAEAAA